VRVHWQTRGLLLEPIAATNPSTTVPSPPSVMPDLVTPNVCRSSSAQRTASPR
jgi:hypothetical protein